jgi:copper chaperone CopZ
VQKALETLPWVRKVHVEFTKKQGVVTVETEKYDEKALLKALEKGGFKGHVISGAEAAAEPGAAGKSAKTLEAKKIDPDRELVYNVEGLT